MVTIYAPVWVLLLIAGLGAAWYIGYRIGIIDGLRRAKSVKSFDFEIAFCEMAVYDARGNSASEDDMREVGQRLADTLPANELLALGASGFFDRIGPVYVSTDKYAEILTIIARSVIENDAHTAPN